MSICINNIKKFSFSLLRKNVLKPLVVITSRQLYTPLSMGMNGYLNTRDYVKSQFFNVDHLFLKKMKSVVEKDDESLVFTEDLKTMLHIVEKNPEQLDILYKMVKKYYSQNNLRFGSFVFGTVLMRALYHLDEPDLALQAYKDPDLKGFFDQIMTHQLLMDLLYNHGRYEDVQDVYNCLKEKNINNIVNPTNPFILVMAACYKQNTDESYKYAIDLFKEVKLRGYELPRRGIIFLAALALRRNKPEIALEVISSARTVRYINVRCIKVEAYTALRRFDEVLIFFNNTLQQDSPVQQKLSYFQDTIEKVEAAVENDESKEAQDIKNMLKQLRTHEYVQNSTLHEHICSPIEQFKPDQRRNLKPNFNQQSDRQFNRYKSNTRSIDNNYYNKPEMKNTF